MATWASDGTRADVQDIHDNDAVDGDTITIPAGEYNWDATTLTISKGITLQGSTTIDIDAQTADDLTILHVYTGVSGNQPMIRLNTVVDKYYRITGITFQQGQTTTVNSNGMIRLTGPCLTVRVDNCHFNEIPKEDNRVSAEGPCGVIDHNIFDQTTSAGFPLHMKGYNWGGDTGTWGDLSWSEPPGYGGALFMFVEDNVFINSSVTPRGVHDAVAGGRFVLRYNDMTNMLVGSHGTEVGRVRGVRAIEVYNNFYHWPVGGLAGIGSLRSGSFVMHDNRHDGTLSDQTMIISGWRAFANDNPTFGSASGSNAWDINATESDGTHVDGHSSYLFDTGTCGSGSNSTTIVDLSKSWTTNQWANYTAETTSGDLSIIISNTATTLTVFFENGRSTGVVWASSMTYNIRKVLVVMDSACRGTGDLIVDNPPVNDNTGIVSDPHQELEPCYSWNNTWEPTGADLNTIVPSNHCDMFLFEGRDFYSDTAMPGYTPYTYPHPLQGVTSFHGSNLLLAARL